jgi:hypothetical protein
MYNAKMLREDVYAAIDTERDFQDRKWGTIEQHPHEVAGYILLMQKLLNDATNAWSTSSSDYPALVEIRKALAVGVACCEQHGTVCRSKHQEMERMR